MRPIFSSEREDRVSDYFEHFVDRRGSQLRHVLERPAATLQLLRDVRALPVVSARLTADLQGREILGQLDRTWLRRHALAGATAVLGLPDDAADYIRGSSGSKYSLRKRSRTARELGVRIERVDAPDRRRELRAIADEYERSNPRERFRIAAPDNEDMLEHRFWFVARVEGRPILLAVLPAEGEWAALRYFRTLEPTEEATLARYLMMEEIVRALVAQGVRRVVVGLGPHRLGNGVRRFQRMVGFRVVRLRVVPVRSAAVAMPSPQRSGASVRPWLPAAEPARPLGRSNA